MARTTTGHKLSLLTDRMMKRDHFKQPVPLKKYNRVNAKASGLKMCVDVLTVTVCLQGF